MTSQWSPPAHTLPSMGVPRDKSGGAISDWNNMIMNNSPPTTSPSKSLNLLEVIQKGKIIWINQIDLGTIQNLFYSILDIWIDFMWVSIYLIH